MLESAVMRLTRRSFIRWVLSSGAALACPFPMPASAAGPGGERKAPTPLLHSEGNAVCHAVRDGEDLPVPAPDRRCDVVIVGGGPSGLAAASELAGTDYLLLEKEGHLGGNAYAETWRGLDYC